MADESTLFDPINNLVNICLENCLQVALLDNRWSFKIKVFTALLEEIVASDCAIAESDHYDFAHKVRFHARDLIKVLQTDLLNIWLVQLINGLLVQVIFGVFDLVGQLYFWNIEHERIRGFFHLHLFDISYAAWRQRLSLSEDSIFLDGSYGSDDRPTDIVFGTFFLVQVFKLREIYEIISDQADVVWQTVDLLYLI